MPQRPEGSLFLHYPCFDGVVSGAIAWDYLESTKGWLLRHVRPVNYDRAKTWVRFPLPRRSAVVDFLYHPGAEFWADHHATTFATEACRIDYERNSERKTLLYDSRSPSCAMLLWKNVQATSTDFPRYAEMAHWANRIDSAQYSSVDEALFGSGAAMTINLSLVDGAGNAYGEMLLRSLRTMTLEQVAAMTDVRSRADGIRARIECGLQLVRSSITLEPGEIAVFQASPEKSSIVSRYSAYYFFRDARYSVSLIHSNSNAKITAMRNPWLEFESVHLGMIFQKYGGGGHQRVASVVLPHNGVAPTDVLTSIVSDIRSSDSLSSHDHERITA